MLGCYHFILLGNSLVNHVFDIDPFLFFAWALSFHLACYILICSNIGYDFSFCESLFMCVPNKLTLSFIMLSGWSVEVCFLITGSPRVPCGYWHCFQPFSGLFSFNHFFFFSLGLVPSRMWVHYIYFYFNIFCKLKLCFVSFFQLFFPFSLETRRLWCLGTVPWVGAFW